MILQVNFCLPYGICMSFLLFFYLVQMCIYIWLIPIFSIYLMNSNIDTYHPHCLPDFLLQGCKEMESILWGYLHLFLIKKKKKKHWLLFVYYSRCSSLMLSLLRPFIKKESGNWSTIILIAPKYFSWCSLCQYQWSDISEKLFFLH